MKRLVVALVLAAVAAPRAHAAVLPPPVAHPNPATYGIKLDYTLPLRTPSGAIATLTPLLPAATAAAVADLKYLSFQIHDDLGGFTPATIGGHAIAGATGGRDIVGAPAGRPELPLFAQHAGDTVESFTFTGGTTPPPDNGRQPVPGVGQPPVSPPPPSPGNVPPPNQGFGGRPEPPPPSGGETTTTEPTTTTPKPPPTTTTTTTATTPTTTTETTTTTTATVPSPPTTTTPPTPGPSAGSCGAPGVAITSSLNGCRIYAVNMAPGDATTERLTITNTSGSAYTLSLKAAGTQNQLWNDLRMGVWEAGSPPPSPLPPLLDWTTQFNALTTLQAGQSVTYLIQLYLPTSAGNADQSLAAVIDFVWRATG